MNFIFISICLLTGCHKREPVIPIPTNPCLFNACDTSKLEIVWQKPISMDTLGQVFSIYPFYFNNNVLFSRSTFEEAIDTLKMLDSKTGSIKWQWADYLIGRKPSFTKHIKFLQNTKFLFTTWKDVYCVDALNGKTVWRSQLESGEGHPRISGINDYVYHNRILKTNPITEKSYLVRANINVGKWDTIYTQSIIEGFEPDIEPPSVSWTNNKGDEIVFFQIRYWNFSASKGRIDWVALNLKTKKEEFRHNDIDKWQLGTVHNAVMLDDKIYFLGVISVFCVNKNDGKILWEKVFDINTETFTSSPPFIAEGKLFVKPNNRTLYALDPDTGNQIWVDKDNGSGCRGMIYHDGLLYYTCDGNGKIYAVEAATGKKIWAEPSPNIYKNAKNGNKRYENANIGTGGIAIDPEQGVLFTSDFYFAMCLKLPKK